MGGRRRSRSELPHAPLTLVHPLSVPGAQVDGAPLLEELPRALAMPALQLLRAVLAWSRDPAETAAALDSAAVGALERRLLDRPRPEAPWTPLAVLAGAMADPLTARPDQVSLACLAVSDWAIDAGHEHTALAYAEAAALAWPANARYAWVAGRMMRSHGRMKEAERWLRRAHRVAVWTDDWETQARSLNSLGNVHYTRGKFGTSKGLHLRALRITSRREMRPLQGEVCHDLFVIHAETGDSLLAANFAEAAFHIYFPAHHRLLDLVGDIAHFWNSRGYFRRSLPVFEALLGRVTSPDQKLRAIAGAARASGGIGDANTFDYFWAAARQLTPLVENTGLVAAAFFEIALGGFELRARDVAREAVEIAVKEARTAGVADVLVKASDLRDRMANPSHIVSLTRVTDVREVPGEELARSLLDSLREASLSNAN